ncbi:MAG TPA: C13 family peptidase [Solirubrobacteraceae bacterium]|jgi:hypothetical protein|nr:C13 family peptidase [Solirubrobacteraceae bacterium]
MTILDDRILGQISDSAYRSLDPLSVSHTNLSVDHRIREQGESLGPEFQGLVAERQSVLVFADEAPLANFGHPCRYLLYDPQTAEQLADLPARFPPWGESLPESLRGFHTPVQPAAASSLFHVHPTFRCPVIIPDGERYAIFYSGMSNSRHLNDMEFGYRTLVHVYGFKPENVTVLSYNGTTNTQEGANTVWPGDKTPYQIKVNGEGRRSAFEGAIDALKAKIGANDLLFIHTNNHGDNWGSESFLCEYPSWGEYLAGDFCAKLHELPRYRALIAMMEQCNSGGFVAPVLASSTAAATTIATAASATQSSWASPDGLWDSFARDWFAAQAWATPYGGPLAFNPDTNHDGKIEATEAFNYANVVRNPQDTPQYGQSSQAGGNVFLGEEYTIVWWWCQLIREALEHRYHELSQAKYHEQLRKLEPQLRELAQSIDARSEELRDETEARIREIVSS